MLTKLTKINNYVAVFYTILGFVSITQSSRSSHRFERDIIICYDHIVFERSKMEFAKYREL
jgi:hypothetical protein